MEDYLIDILMIDDLIEQYRVALLKLGRNREYHALVKNSLHSSSPLNLIHCINDAIEICKLLGVSRLEDLEDYIKSQINTLNNFLISPQDPREFENAVDSLKTTFKLAEAEYSKRTSSLDEDEHNRLNEAFSCYINYSNYSAIVMGVSVIESRLYSLMMSKQPNAKLGKMTLGQLIAEYIENEEDYEYVIPDKHMPLLKYCNNYRVFSVHPKKEKITRSNATAILCMTCSFLFDSDMKPSRSKD